MKMLSLVSLTVLAFAVFSPSAHADEPDAAQIAKLVPQLQAMLNELMKANGGEAMDPAPATPAAPAAPTPAATTTFTPTTSATTALPSTAHTSRSSRTALGSTALQTSSLRTGHLGPSPSLTGAPRLNDDEWRQLFPQKK
ncbi:MAG TPA: hypothetical protein VK961_21785 [Chthoniobacter sp.]|nr:hypothetical protein [Chthoniobacter sp.]